MTSFGPFSIERKVEGRRSVPVPDPEFGLPYLAEPARRHNVVRATLRLFGRKILSWISDWEDVPLHAAISEGCVGDAGGWRSRFAPELF